MRLAWLQGVGWLVFVLPVLLPDAMADEGMWLFSDLPKERLKQKYGFEPDEAWLRHVMLSSVRFNSGGSASFVSSTGLVLTNHHVAADTLQKISTGEKNYYRDGFLARTVADEIPSPDLELNQLISIEDVSAEVNAAVTSGMSTAEALAARRAAMFEIEKRSLGQTGLRSDVVTLYGGGPVPSVSLPEVHRHPPGLGPRVVDRLLSAATRTISNSPGTAWICACFACMKTASPRRWSTS